MKKSRILEERRSCKAERVLKNYSLNIYELSHSL